jgi:NIMA (never in mitosis gene a)-related kinase
MMALKPPFQAEDMEGLYKRVTKGEYSQMPLTYSIDLNSLIRILLQTDPYKRPSCCTNIN